MSPILVRPVREQLEHDRIIRLLPARYKRRFEVGINPGSEQNAGIGTGNAALYPDAVLYSSEKSHRLQGIVEVETVESINHLEAMAEWAVYSRLKVPFHLYVPVSALDVARRLSADQHATVAEIWSFDNVGDQVRFTLVHKLPEPARPVSGPPVILSAPKAVPKPDTPEPEKPAKAEKPDKVAKAEKPQKREEPAVKPRPAAPRPVPKPVKVAKAAKPATPVKPAKAAKAGKKAGSNGKSARPPAPARNAAPARKPTRSAAKAAPKRAQTASRGRASTTRKGSGAPKRK